MIAPCFAKSMWTVIPFQSFADSRFYQHDDGIVYKNNFLYVEIKDLNDDGYNHIIFTGTLKLKSEK